MYFCIVVPASLTFVFTLLISLDRQNTCYLFVCQGNYLLRLKAKKKCSKSRLVIAQTKPSSKYSTCSSDLKKKLLSKNIT